MNLGKTGILIFAYNRPSHLKRVLIAIESLNITSKIILIIDGAKNVADKINQKSMLLMANRFKKKNFKVLCRKKNLGLSKSITSGIDTFAKKFEGLIILEDDVVPYKSFFFFIKKTFKSYSKKKDVIAICGYQNKNFNLYNEKILKPILLSNFTPWGWAISSKKWMQSKKLMKKTNFKFLDSIPDFFKKYLNKNYQKKKGKNLWSLKFIYENYKGKKKYIYPNFSLVKNIGFDGTGVNSKATNIFDVKDKNPKKILNLKKLTIDKKLIKKHNTFFKKNIKYFY